MGAVGCGRDCSAAVQLAFASSKVPPLMSRCSGHFCTSCAKPGLLHLNWQKQDSPGCRNPHPPAPPSPPSMVQVARIPGQAAAATTHPLLHCRQGGCDVGWSLSVAAPGQLEGQRARHPLHHKHRRQRGVAATCGRMSVRFGWSGWVGEGRRARDTHHMHQAACLHMATTSHVPPASNISLLYHPPLAPAPPIRTLWPSAAPTHLLTVN